MINISPAAQQALKENAVQQIKINIEPLTGTPFTVENKDILLNGLKFETHTLDGEELEIGNMNSAILNLSLDNESGKFNGKRFAGAVLRAKIGVETANGIIEDIPLGKFTVDEQPRLWETISLEAYDNMVRMDIPYEPSTVWPNSLRNLVRECVEQSGLFCNDYSMFPEDYVIISPPKGDNLTCRQVAMWACQCVCVNGYADENGDIKFAFYRKYTPEALETEIGEILVSEENEPLIINGVGNVHYHLKSSERFIKNMMIEEEDITITGHQFIDDNNMLYPTEVNKEYLIETKGNAVFNALTDSAKIKISNSVNEAIKGFTYRAFTAEIVSLPFLQAGDSIAYHDENGVYQTFITNWEYEPNGTMAISAKAKSLREKGYAPLGSLTPGQRAIIDAVNSKVETTQAELTTQEQATLHLNQTAASAMGLYYTERSDGNGGTIKYWHDNAVLEDSNYITMQNSNGSFSTNSGWNNGNPVWTQGVDKFGNAICNLLNVIGIQAEWIDADSITTDKLSIGQSERGTNLIPDSSFESNSLCIQGAYNKEFTELITPGHNEFWIAKTMSASSSYDAVDTYYLPAPSEGGFDGNKAILDINLKGRIDNTDNLFAIEAANTIPVELITHTFSYYYRVKKPYDLTSAKVQYVVKIQWLNVNGAEISVFVDGFTAEYENSENWRRRYFTVTPPNGAVSCRIAIGFQCPDNSIVTTDAETEESGYRDLAFASIDGLLFEQGTILNSWTCSKDEVTNNGVIINSKGLNVANGKIYVSDTLGNKVLFTDGNQILQFIGGYTSNKYDVLSGDISARMASRPAQYVDNKLENEFLGYEYTTIDEHGKEEPLARIGIHFPIDSSENGGVTQHSPRDKTRPFTFDNPNGFMFNGEYPLISDAQYGNNLDVLTSPGWYYGKDPISERLNQYPIEGEYILMVEKSDTKVFQTLTDASLKRMFKRYCTSGTFPLDWSGWVSYSADNRVKNINDNTETAFCGGNIGLLSAGTYIQTDVNEINIVSPTDFNECHTYPVKECGLLEVFKGAGYTFQRYTTFGGHVYVRYANIENLTNDNTWSAWTQI